MLPYINIFGKAIPVYGLCIVLGFTAAGIIIKLRCRQLSYDKVIVLCSLTLAGMVFGGSALYVIVTYPPEYILYSIKKFDFSFLMSGMVFYGGVAGGLGGMLLGKKLVGIPFTLLEDLVIPLVPMGHALGRVGCTMAGCCHGIEYYGIFAIKNVHYPPEMSFFPVQPVEAVFNVLIGICLFIYIKKPHKKGDVILRYFLMYPPLRFCLEFLRGDRARGIYAGLSTSQWISLVLFAVAIFISLKKLRKLS